MLRRSMLNTSALISAGAVLTACGATTLSSPGTIPAQIVNDVNGALNQMAMLLPALTATTPPALTAAQEAPLLVDVNLAQGFMATISGNTPAQTGVTVLARAEGYFNAVLAGLVAVPIPPPYNLIVIAANVIAPELENYVNSLLPPPVAAPPAPTPAAARAAKLGHKMTIGQARAVLKIEAAP